MLPTNMSYFKKHLRKKRQYFVFLKEVPINILYTALTLAFSDKLLNTQGLLQGVFS